MKSFLLVLTLTLLSSTLCRAELKVVMLDVGMGQSILLTENNHGILIDTGLSSYGEHISQRMHVYGVKKLDYLILSHLHPDHAGGYLQIRDTWPNTPVFDDCHISPILHPSEQIFFDRTRKFLSNDPLHQCLEGGDSFVWQGNTITTLWPKKTNKATDINAHSLVLLVSTSQGRTVLIMGDVNKTVEREITPIIKPLLSNSDLDLYIVNHHGAIDTSSLEFLQMLHPKIALISVGKENPYGHPAETTLNMLRSHVEKILRTDQDGEICFEIRDDFFMPCFLPQ